jgi:hypothetical protein
MQVQHRHTFKTLALQEQARWEIKRAKQYLSRNCSPFQM